MPVGEESLALQVRYADTSAQKRLKATTTKKRQFRSNEYNSVVNSSYYNHSHITCGVASQYGNRAWLRHNSKSSIVSKETDRVSSRDAQSSSPLTRKNWDRSQNWKNTGDENRDFFCRNSAPADTSSRLDTVLEYDDDRVSETRSECTAVPTISDIRMLGSRSKTSSGSLSDPGDSYGGREYRSKDRSVIS
ncbi:hypothetical protein BDD12DRAFT_428934 [Trichophaea hybrida]|nr:hypothetical protein BDD12DRAFT_428934 [Trichophaea hybrida]